MPELHEPFGDRLDVRTHAALHANTAITSPAIATPGPTFPTSPTVGQVFVETDTGFVLVWTGTIWKPLLPSGTILAFAGSVLPTGTYWCDGGLRNRTTDAFLFAAIGTTYGVGDGSTTFGLPNIQGRTIVCRNPSDALWDTLGETRGAATVQLTDAHLSSHEHSLNNHIHDMSMHIHTLGSHTHGSTGLQSSNHTHNFNLEYTGNTSHHHAAGINRPAEGPTGGGVGLLFTTSGISDNHSHTTGFPNVNATAGISPSDTGGASGNTGTVGSDTAHDNIQPSIVFNYIIAA